MVHIIDGNILDSKEDIIAHQCNCTSFTWSGVAKVIFDTHPYSNTYYPKFNSVRIPGKFSIHGTGKQRVIANLYAQVYKGKPLKGGTDTYTKRKHYFKTSLQDMMKDNLGKSVALPFNIGCGLAGGRWEDYLDMVTEAASRYGDIILYRI